MVWLQLSCTRLDLGCYAGGWSQIAIERCFKQGKEGKVVGVDLIETEPLHNLVFIQGDIRDPEVKKKVAAEFPTGIDSIISDIAPRPTGSPVTDHIESAKLCRDLCKFALPMLKRNGSLLVKMFQGPHTTEFVEILKVGFRLVKIIKPSATR